MKRSLQLLVIGLVACLQAYEARAISFNGDLDFMSYNNSYNNGNLADATALVHVGLGLTLTGSGDLDIGAGKTVSFLLPYNFDQGSSPFASFGDYTLSVGSASSVMNGAQRHLSGIGTLTGGTFDPTSVVFDFYLYNNGEFNKYSIETVDPNIPPVTLAGALTAPENEDDFLSPGDDRKTVPDGDTTRGLLAASLSALGIARRLVMRV